MTFDPATLRRACAPALLLLSAALPPRPAHATYSIVAADANSRQVGGAGTSCVAPTDVILIYAAVAGKGAVHAQAQSNAAGRDRAAQMLGQGAAPGDIVQAITAPAFDADASTRQYGVVTLSAAAGFTGADNGAYAADKQVSVGSYVGSVQGNILTGAAVIDQAAAAFQTTGCDLADKLMLALEAGAAGGGGDSRCTPNGNPSSSAFVQVLAPDGNILLAIDVTDPGDMTNVNPLPALRQQFNAWRATHPCPAPPAAPADPNSVAGSPNATVPTDATPSAAQPDSRGSGNSCAQSGGAWAAGMVAVWGCLRRRARAG